MYKELISVIVPVYRVEKYLRKAVDSLIGQTYKELEIILVDDGSDDGSGEICDEYATIDSRIMVIHKQNGGLSDARNAGLDVASGKLLSFMDSDDYLDKNFYEVLCAEMDDDVDVACCTMAYEGEYEFCGNVRVKNDNIYATKLDKKEAMRAFLLWGGKVDIVACGKLYRRRLFDNLRFPTGRSSEDIPIIWQIIKQCSHVACVDNVYYHYLQRAGSITGGEFFIERCDGNLFALEILNEVRNEFPEMEEEAASLYVNELYDNIHQILNTKNAEIFSETFIELQTRLRAMEDYISSTNLIDEQRKEAMLYAVKASFDEQKIRHNKDNVTSKLLRFYNLLLQWTADFIEECSITERLRRDGVKNVAIYGMKELGELTCKMLSKEGLEVKYAIDQRGDNLKANIPIFSMSQIDNNSRIPKVDAIIVTPVTFFEEIKPLLEKRFPKTSIYDLSELVFGESD